MSNQQQSASLAQVLSLTQTMKLKANDELWEELVEIEQQRQLMIEAIFPIENPQQNEKEVLEKIIELNAQIESQCRQQKTSIQQKLSGVNSNKKAISAYQQK